MAKILDERMSSTFSKQHYQEETFFKENKLTYPEKHYLESNEQPIPKDWQKLLDEDKENNKKSVSENSWPLTKLTDIKRSTFFWVSDDQIKDKKGKQVSWWNKETRKSGDVDFTEEQYKKVESAIKYQKNVLKNLGWYRSNRSEKTNEIAKDSWEYYKTQRQWWHKIIRVTDGDTMTFEGLIATPLLLSNNKHKVVLNNTVRILCLDTDETFWLRYQQKPLEKNLPTRLGYVQKTVAKIANKIYQDQEWCVVPIAIDKYNRTLALVYTPDGIPWSRLLITNYAAAIYPIAINNNQSWPSFAVMPQFIKTLWWINDYWKDLYPKLPDPNQN